MIPSEKKIILISSNKELIDSWKKEFNDYHEQISIESEVIIESVLSASLVFLDLTSSFSFWRSLRKIKLKDSTTIIAIISGHTQSDKKFLHMQQSSSVVHYLFYPFIKEQINHYKKSMHKLLLSLPESNDDDTLNYKIVARFNEIFERIIFNKPFTYDILKSEIQSLFYDYLQYNHVFILDSEKQTSFRLKEFKFETAFEFSIDDIMQHDEFLQMFNYKIPILKNDIRQRDAFYQKFIKKLNPEVNRILLIPISTPDGKNIYWILMKKSPIPISSYQFFISQFIIKTFLVGNTFIQNYAIDLFKWDRYKNIKRDLVVFRNIFDSFKFGLFMLDLKFNVKFANKAAANILQKDVSEIENYPLSKVFHQEKFELLENNIQIRDNEYRGEFELVIKGNQKKMIGFSFYPRILIDGEDYILLIFKDISDLKALEEENLRKDRLATLGIIASEIAHEIRNPLAGIRAIAETLKDEMNEHPTISEYTNRIIRQTERVESLIKNLFSYTKPPRPTLEKCNIRDLLDEVFLMLSDKFKIKKIITQIDIEKDNEYLFVDQNQMLQVFNNIIQNSIDAIDSDGKITISVFRTESIPEQARQFINMKPGHHYIKIIIKDTGIGISDEDKPKLFLPFFSTKDSGIGLGLSIVYQIIKEHEGYIFYESTKGQGTECHIILPMPGE